MSNCNLKFKNTLNFLPSLQPNKDKHESSKNMRTFQKAQPATKDGVRNYLTPIERRELEAEQEKLRKEITKWEKRNNRKFITRCRKLEVESMTPTGFDKLLESIIRHVMRVKPYPKKIVSCISTFLESKLDEDTMERLDIDESDLELTVDFGSRVTCAVDDVAEMLEESTFDEAPSDFRHMDYKGALKPIWNVKLGSAYRDEQMTSFEISKLDPAPRDSRHLAYQESSAVVVKPLKVKELKLRPDIDIESNVLDKSEIDAPPLDEFHRGYEPVGIYSDVILNQQEYSKPDPAPKDSRHPDYQKGDGMCNMDEQGYDNDEAEVVEEEVKEMTTNLFQEEISA